MKTLLKYLSSLFSDSKKIKNTNEVSLPPVAKFEFTLISKEERLTNRCDKYEFIIE